MVAPNGARLTGDDHPALPVTIPEIVATAKSCAVAGAGAIHFHVRDANRAHILDAGLYREALDELRREVPMMHHQITTETVGRYAPADMRRVTIASQPEGVSIGVVEMMPSGAPAPDLLFARTSGPSWQDVGICQLAKNQRLVPVCYRSLFRRDVAS
jgi:uncharacterized protein (DUF849 family)